MSIIDQVKQIAGKVLKSQGYNPNTLSVDSFAPIKQLTNFVDASGKIINTVAPQIMNTVNNDLQTMRNWQAQGVYVPPASSSPIADFIKGLPVVPRMLNPFGMGSTSPVELGKTNIGSMVNGFIDVNPLVKSAAQKIKTGARLTNEERNASNQQTMDIAMGLTGGIEGGSGLGPKEFPSANTRDVLTTMGEGKNALRGLLSESPAQTAARRMANLEPSDVYTAPIDRIRQSASKYLSEPNIPVQDFEKFMDNSMKGTNVKNKINVFDYLRTPDRVLNKMGLDKEAVQLRTAWDSYLEELPKEIQRVTSWSKQVTPESNGTIFKYLDGQINKNALAPNELKVATEIKSYLSGFADRLHLPEDSRISSYITHIWEKGAMKNEFPDEIANLIRDKIPGSVYDPFVQERLGVKGYKEDTWAALDAYIKRGLRKAWMDPVESDVQRAAAGLEDSQYNYVKRYMDRVNLRPTEIDNLIDNTIKSSPIGYKLGQRPVATITRTARQMVSRGLLGLNPTSALKNLSQGANTYAELGEKYTVLGYSKVAQNMPKLLAGKQTELEAAGVLRDAFVQDRLLSSTKQKIQKIDEGLYSLFTMAEKINRGAAYWGAKAKYINEGLSEVEAINKAKDVVRKTQFTFGSIDTPVALQSDIVKTLAQFQSYGIKQFEFLGEKVANKEWAGIARYIGASLLFALTAGKVIGFDLKEMIPSVRIGVPPTLKLPAEIGKAVLNSPDQYGQTPSLQEKLQNVGSAAISYIPAGNQIKKSVQGLQAYSQGASYTPTGRTRFEVPQTPLNAVKMGLFGQYSIPQGQEYIQNLGKSQSKALYEKYKTTKANDPAAASAMMNKVLKSNPSLYREVLSLKNDEAIGVTDEERKIRNMGVSDGSRARAIANILRKIPARKERNAKVAELQKKSIITKEVYAQLIKLKAQGKL